MTKKRFLNDVNLTEIHYAKDGSSVTFIFLNMSDGAVVGTLTCVGVAFFSCSNDPDCTLPQYVGEVTCTPIANRKDALSLLNKLGYGYSDPSGIELVEVTAELFHVHLEGGLMIDVVCRETR